MLSSILFIKNSLVTSPKSVSLKRKKRKSNYFSKAHRENELTWDALGVTNWPSVPCAVGFPGSWTSSPKPGNVQENQATWCPLSARCQARCGVKRWMKSSAVPAGLPRGLLFLGSACEDGQWGGSLWKQTYDLGLWNCSLLMCLPWLLF